MTKVPTAGRARGVTYIDESGEEVFQPADLVILATYTLGNNHLLMLSGIGTPYDPVDRQGHAGKKSYAPIQFGVNVFMDKPLNRFMGAGGTGIRMADFDADVFDHSNVGFIRGGVIGATMTGTQPISTFGDLPRSVKVPRWGSAWKKASMEWYDRTANIGFGGEHIPYKATISISTRRYKNPAGDPLLRMTINWRDNERKMVDFMNNKMVEIAHAMGAKDVNPFPGYGDYDVTRYQSTHVQGGTIMASPPDRGVVNMHQQHWDISNLFVHRRVHVSEQRRRQSHAHHPGANLSHRRQADRHLPEETRNVGLSGTRFSGTGFSLWRFRFQPGNTSFAQQTFAQQTH